MWTETQLQKNNYMQRFKYLQIELLQKAFQTVSMTFAHCPKVGKNEKYVSVNNYTVFLGNFTTWLDQLL